MPRTILRLLILTLIGMPCVTLCQTAAEGEALLKKLANGHPMVKGSLWGVGTDNPSASVFVPENKWTRLKPKDQLSLCLYAQSLIPKIRANPDPYLGIPRSAPVYATFRARAISLCSDCFTIIIGPVKSATTVVVDRTVVQGDSVWHRDEFHSGMKWSEFSAKARSGGK